MAIDGVALLAENGGCCDECGSDGGVDESRIGGWSSYYIKHDDENDDCFASRAPLRCFRLPTTTVAE